jgi:hypothetical protein
MGGIHRIPKKDLKFGALIKVLRDEVLKIPSNPPRNVGSSG